MARLLRRTEATKSSFLDQKFLRRQRQTSLKESRLWYVDLDTWMASTTSGSAPQTQAQQQSGTAAAAAAPPPEQQLSTPVDDAQTHCALSGERFEQFWDEEHQEWRYRGAKRLDAEEAAAYGLQEGAIVLASALGAPPAHILQPEGAGGVLAELQEEQEVAAELAAAAAEAADQAEGSPTQLPPLVGKQAAGVKHSRDDSAAERGGELQPEGKRVKLEPVA